MLLIYLLTYLLICFADADEQNVVTNKRSTVPQYSLQLVLGEHIIMRPSIGVALSVVSVRPSVCPSVHPVPPIF